MTIVVSGVVDIAQESLAAMHDALLTMQAASRAEDGCLDYTFSIEIGDPEKLRISERWRDHAALAGHFRSPHMARFREAMAAHPPRDIEVTFFEASETAPPGA